MCDVNKTNPEAAKEQSELISCNYDYFNYNKA